MRFFKNLLLFTGAVGLAIGLLAYFTGGALVHPYAWYILLFFVFITVATFYITRLGIRYDSNNFQLYYFASMGLRMLLSIGVVFVYVYLFSEHELQFVLNFFVLYFLFTGFEIFSILANFAPQLKKPDEV